jgi:hypothetical protein
VPLAAGGALGIGGDVGIDLLAKQKLIDRSKAFSDTAHDGLVAIVNQANRATRLPRVALAWPSFADQNSYGGGITFLWKVGQYAGDEDHGFDFSQPRGDPRTPEGVAYFRAHQCKLAGDHSPLCLDASMGHPNIAGAQTYASAVIGQLLPLVGAE